MDVMHECNQQVIMVIYGINEKHWLVFCIYAITNYRL